MKSFAVTLVALTLSLSTITAKAESADDAKALLDQAVATFKAKGKDAAIQEINAGGKWNKGALYVVATQYDGLNVAHSVNPKFTGKNMLGAKDAAGKPFVKEVIAGVQANGSIQLDLRWANPLTKQIGDATMFAKAVPGMDVYVGTILFK